MSYISELPHAVAQLRNMRAKIGAGAHGHVAPLQQLGAPRAGFGTPDAALDFVKARDLVHNHAVIAVRDGDSVRHHPVQLREGPFEGSFGTIEPEVFPNLAELDSYVSAVRGYGHEQVRMAEYVTPLPASYRSVRSHIPTETVRAATEVTGGLVVAAAIAAPIAGLVHLNTDR